MEWDQEVGGIRRMDLLVTRTAVLRRSLRELDLIRRTGVTVVVPGVYRFQAYVRAQDITTDQGIGFRIFGVGGPPLDARMCFR